MSMTAGTTKSRPSRAKVALVSAMTLGLAAGGVALAAPAQAATTNYACTVTPLKPVFAGFNSSGTKLVDYQIQVRCYNNRSVYIEQQRWESDDWPNGDDHLGNSSFSRSLGYYSGIVTIHNVRTLTNTEIGNEEVYQKVRHQEGAGGVWSPFTGWKSSGTTSMSN
ncbi:hypothetical protein TV39_17570 [Arthrobacter sp. SPG23]|uniref:hypothetical protein n=1 Tax=Arthrobacter sp. SPG23 TaxID=1610703 RepID=UPI0005BDCDCB|nr:hypothetical protein [Arthrobacter sp. SPG23]KIS25869.1 hypothetical protein TV39_17570 [Arthrobacter sp. SPG23]